MEITPRTSSVALSVGWLLLAAYFAWDKSSASQVVSLNDPAALVAAVACASMVVLLKTKRRGALLLSLGVAAVGAVYFALHLLIGPEGVLWLVRGIPAIGLCIAVATCIHIARRLW